MRLWRSLALLLVFVLPLVAAGLALAEDLDVDGLFDSAKKSYAEKRYGKSLADLRLLTAEVGRARVAQVRAALPAAPEGWTAREDSGDEGTAALGMFGGGFTAARRYERGEESRVKIEMMGDSPLIASFSMWLTNPAFLPANMKVVTVKGKKALLESDDDSKRYSLRLLLNENTTLLTIEGEGVAKKDVAETFANALDLDAIDKVLRD